MTHPQARPKPSRRGASIACEPVHVWNPAGFDPRDYLPEALHRYGDCARYFMHRIHYAPVFNREHLGKFVPLKAEYMRPFFPGNEIYKEIRESLIEGDAMRCDNHYIEGEKSYGYKLGPEFARMPHHMVAITDRLLAKKMRQNREDWIRTPDGVHRHLLYWLRQLEIDYPAAHDSLLAADDYDPIDGTAIAKIRDCGFFFDVCRYGRVHTNLTNLRSSLRGFLSYRGEPLVNLDIRNSQPLIFSILLRERYGSDQAMPPDVRLYVDLVQAGKFYDYLMAEGGIPLEKRSKFKGQFFGHVFFCPNWPETNAAQMFGQQFPNVYSAIQAFKEPEHAALAHRLQRAESSLMIGGVVGRCVAELPRTFIATIHDSILTTRDQADAIRSLMMEEFGKVGLRPTINVEELSRPGHLSKDQKVTS